MTPWGRAIATSSCSVLSFHQCDVSYIYDIDHRCYINDMPQLSHSPQVLVGGAQTAVAGMLPIGRQTRTPVGGNIRLGGRAHMKKHIVLGVGATVAVATSAALFGAGVAAAAPNVVGMPYDDAVSVINHSGGSAVVATRVGSKLDDSDCLVTNAWDGVFLRGTSIGGSRHTNGEVMLALNCNGSVAKAGKPGNSAASPAGREANAEQREAAATTPDQ